ncbi:hypothetical protein ACLOJK_025131 [Asimina triloba]
MSSAQDPFYIVKEEIQDSLLFYILRNSKPLFINGKIVLQILENEFTSQKSSLLVVKALSGSALLLNNCFLDRKVDELDKAIAVAARDPAWYGIDEVELDRRRKWTNTARNQVLNVRKAVESGKQQSNPFGTSVNGPRKGLMRLPNNHEQEAGRSTEYSAEEDDFVTSESDRQLLLIKQQDEELDELSASVERIGDVGLTIHEELRGQERILNDLNSEMDSTANKLDFVQHDSELTEVPGKIIECIDESSKDVERDDTLYYLTFIFQLEAYGDKINQGTDESQRHAEDTGTH